MSKDRMDARALRHCEEGQMDRLRDWVAQAEADLDQPGPGGEAALHVACRQGFIRCVRVLVAAGANMDLADDAGRTPLHCSLMEGHVSISILLLHSGADTDLQNAVGDAAIHIAARKGLLSVVRTLCALGCSLDTPNGGGFYPLHLAARYGHIDVIRCLCLSGCNVEQRNIDGIKAEIMAFKQSHYHVGELLNKLRIPSNYEAYVNQLMPTDHSLSKIIVKFIGEQGSGKSTLVRSLKAGYFIGLFARSKSQSSTTGKSCPASPTNTHIEMDVTPHQYKASDVSHYQYTRGIEIHEASFSCGDVYLWDFSGLDTYFQMYDLFLGDPASIYVITFNLRESLARQHYHCSYWLYFLAARLKTFQPTGFANAAVRVILVGTHADEARIPRDAQGAFMSPLAQELRESLVEEFPNLVLEPKVLIADAHLSNSQGVRDVKTAIATCKLHILQSLLKWTGLLEAVMDHMPIWRRELEVFPVITWQDLVARIHRSVNPLAGDDHVQTLLMQLAIMGEAMLFKSEPTDLIILDLAWLCGPDILGGLLSLEAIARARLTGCYTEDDFQGAFPQASASSILPLLKALQLCTQCENDGEVEFEFPCFNLVEKLEGLWTAVDERYSPPTSCYAGVRLKAPYHLLQTVFPRLQVQFRRTAIICQDPDGDLYQWFRGSKLCAGDIEGLVTLEQDGQVMDVKVRGTDSLRLACFYFLEEILAIIDHVLSSITPGATWERHVLSCEELRLHSDSPHCWRPEHVLAAVLSSAGLQAILHNPNLGQEERVMDLVAFGADAACDIIILGGNLPISELSLACQLALARLLDPPDPLGRDWCLLAVKLGLAHKISTLDSEGTTSKTCALLELWGKTKEATIGNLIKKLVDFGREDAAEVLMQSAPLFQINTAPSYDVMTDIAPP